MALVAFYPAVPITLAYLSTVEDRRHNATELFHELIQEFNVYAS